MAKPKPDDPHVDIESCPPHLIPLHDIWISVSQRAMDWARQGDTQRSAEANTIADDIERVYFELRKNAKTAPHDYNQGPRACAGRSMSGLPGKGPALQQNLDHDEDRHTTAGTKRTKPDPHAQAAARFRLGVGAVDRMTAKKSNPPPH